MCNIFNNNGIDNVSTVLSSVGFEIQHVDYSEAKNAETIPIDELNLSDRGRAFWPYPMWTHQFKAVKSALEMNNVCISTSTSSGKTEIFQTIAIETVARRGGKVLAFYCVKALNSQQLRRWERTGLNVGIIDGNHCGKDYRQQVFTTCEVILITPDAMHMILSCLQQGEYGAAIKSFIKQLSLVIIDEIHLYRGVFGSNAAYLFRRINNLRRHYREDAGFPQYVTASATISNPARHSSDICGVSHFVNIGPEDDKSPAGKKTFYYVSKNAEVEEPLSTLVATLINRIAEYEDTKTITFVSGRQQTGRIAMSEEQLESFENNNMIYPFRAGFEDEAREHIYKAMSDGDFKGIISTSALEIGIDISGLNIAIIANMPFDRNSYYQRIGRVGRGGVNNESAVIIINDNSLNSSLLFSPKVNFDIDNVLPELEPALHLDSEAIMACHVGCHIHSALDGCELPNLKTVDDVTQQYFPQSFIQLMKSVLSGNRPGFYDDFINRNCNPHHVSLRSLGIIYQIVENGIVLNNDTVTRAQFLKEAYKGALRNSVRYNTKTGKIEKYLQRVTSFPDRQEKQILTRSLTQNELEFAIHNAQHTKPFYRTYVRPNFLKCKSAFKYGDTLLINLRLYESTHAYGYYECLGRNQRYIPYERAYRDEIQTMGVLIFNSSLNSDNVSTSQISQLIFEAFLIQRAFERNDFEFNSGRLYLPNSKYELLIGDRFLAIYDSNDLNIAKELLDPDLLNRTFKFLVANLDTFSSTLFESPLNDATKDALCTICNSILENPRECLDVTEDNNDENIIAIPAISSRVRYHVTTQTPEIVIECFVAGIFKDASYKNCVTYTLFDCSNPIPYYNVAMDDVELIPAEPIAMFNWQTGNIL